MDASARNVTKSFYEQLRSPDDDLPDFEDAGLRALDDENLTHDFRNMQVDNVNTGESRFTVRSAMDGRGPKNGSPSSKRQFKRKQALTAWAADDDDLDEDVPASLLVENNSEPVQRLDAMAGTTAQGQTAPTSWRTPSPEMGRAQWETVKRQQRLYRDDANTSFQPRSMMAGTWLGSRRERALWRWVNTSSLDSFMRDVYDYYEGGGMWCILCSNALWLLETLFVAILLTFLTQCVDYGKVSTSKSLEQVIIPQCTRKMSGFWNLGIWLYSFFFIWKCVQYFLEIRRLVQIREFYICLLEIPEQDMQTVSWQDIVARIMALREENPKTATNIPARLRRFMGSQSKERLDAHDIANRLMRKENYLIAMINKDVLNLSLPIPFLQGRQLFSKTMEWYLHYGILDMAFNELGQVQQDFLRADRRRILSEKLKQRLFFAGILNLVFAPVVLAYVIIVYFFTYYNEYQKDPKLAAARKYTALAEWKFREFNELPHIFYERLHMSFPFATRYVDQFPKRMTEDIARSVAFMSGAITAVLAVCTILDSELFLGFEITKDRTVLFYLGIFGAIWAMTRGMVSEETAVFNPEYALRNVIEYTHYMPDHWEGRLHSFEVKKEFAELYKMKVVIFLEEVMGIITTPMLLLFALPKCSDQIVDFFREFTIHVDGLGYVCSFAVFDFKKGVGNDGKRGPAPDVREDYYTTKHGKMAASYYGFLDNYVINPRTGIPGHLPPGARHQFHPPPAFPSLNSPTLAADLHTSQAGRPDGRRDFPHSPGDRASSKDPRHHLPSGGRGAKGLSKSRAPRNLRLGESRIAEEPGQALSKKVHVKTDDEFEDDVDDGDGILGESVWETSPAKGLSRENSAANTVEPDAGVLGMIYQLRQTQHGRRGSSMV
ncbi:Autophagy-related protein 9 [Cordyceps militaris CM01]|uniref:Autophagy-related protein 9 n=1 Tax=Cordyceps militaris (strain CM01) TaxID=983644 RepID=G3J3T3_CORMM|nr:Autophagy-related protein 9 [Cordyceps militaris CM01]EGX96558.1 Autophagy-related protein 9 [Cordyceps militaris CM01]